MLSLIVAGTVAAGSCALDWSTEQHGDFITCYEVKIPKIAAMLFEHGGWNSIVADAHKCRHTINLTWQVISGPSDLIKRFEEAGFIQAHINHEKKWIGITCLS